MKKLILILNLAITTIVSIAQNDTTKNEIFDCKYATNEVDEFTDKVKIVTESEMFVSHTDSTLLKYYKNKKHQYFELECCTGKIGNLKVIYYDIRINTNKAYDYYGSLYKDSKVIFKLDDGSMVTLTIDDSDFGDMNYDGNYTTYSTFSVLDEDDVKAFKNKDITKVRFYWSEGYEDYECDSPKLIGNLLKCLD